MAEYKLTIARPASRDLEALPAAIVRRVDAKILALAHDPRPPGTKKLKGEHDLWRMREGDYRIVYSIDDKALAVDIIGRPSYLGIQIQDSRSSERLRPEMR